MLGQLDGVLSTLLTQSLPSLLGGSTPPIRLAITGDLLEVDPRSADALPGDPLPDDASDQFSFDPAQPSGPYTLTQPPYPGPRRVWLLTNGGDRIALSEGEIAWDDVDSRRFTLRPGPRRDLASVTGVQALYGVTAVFTTIGAVLALNVSLQGSDGDGAKLDQAEALALAVIMLNRQAVIDAAHTSFHDGDYTVGSTVTALKLVNASAPSPTSRLLTLRVSLEIKAARALRADEGRPIERILTPGRPHDSSRRVDVDIDLDA